MYLTATKYYFTAIAAVRKPCCDIAAEKTFWISTATSNQVSRMYLLQLLKRKTIAAIFIQNVDFASDTISNTSY